MGHRPATPGWMRPEPIAGVRAPIPSNNADCAGAGGSGPAEEVRPRVACPPCPLAALSHRMVDLAPLEADIAQHAIIETGQGPHGAAGGHLLGQLGRKSAPRGRQSTE